MAYHPEDFSANKIILKKSKTKSYYKMLGAHSKRKINKTVEN